MCSHLTGLILSGYTVVLVLQESIKISKCKDEPLLSMMEGSQPVFICEKMVLFFLFFVSISVHLFFISADSTDCYIARFFKWTDSEQDGKKMS